MRNKSKLIIALICLCLTFFSVGLIACNQTPVIKYTVTFDADGGTEVQSVQVERGEKVQSPQTEKEGYALVGWFNGQVKWNFNVDVVTEDVTLKAKWTTQMYEVEDGVITRTNKLFKDVTVVDIPSEIDGVTITKIGEYAFAYTQAQNKFLETAAKATEEKDRYWIHGDLLLLAYVADGQTAIHIPDGVKIIAGGAFCGWDSVDIPADTSNLLPSGVSKYNITYKVTEIYLPESVEVIGSMAFFRMANVEKIELPSSLRVIDGSAFYLCSKLSDVTGGENVQEIGDYAFCYCTSLKKITLPDNVTALGTNVFSGCSALKTVYLPKNMEHSGSTLFDESCSSLMQVYANSAIRPRIYFVLGSIPQSINVDYYK